MSEIPSERPQSTLQIGTLFLFGSLKTGPRSCIYLAAFTSTFALDFPLFLAFFFARASAFAFSSFRLFVVMVGAPKKA